LRHFDGLVSNGHCWSRVAAAKLSATLAPAVVDLSRARIVARTVGHSVTTTLIGGIGSASASARDKWIARIKKLGAAAR